MTGYMPPVAGLWGPHLRGTVQDQDAIPRPWHLPVCLVVLSRGKRHGYSDGSHDELKPYGQPHVRFPSA